MALPADFPMGTYTVSLHGGLHASFAGTLTVTPDPQNPGKFLANYIHGGEVSKPVDFTFGINPPFIGFAFNKHHTNPNVKFQTATLQPNGNTFGPANVTGLPPNPDKDDDTWTASVPPFPGGEHEHHEHHGQEHKK